MLPSDVAKATFGQIQNRNQAYFYKRCAIPCLFFNYFGTLLRNENLPTVGFKPWISGEGGDYSTSYGETTATHWYS